MLSIWSGPNFSPFGKDLKAMKRSKSIMWVLKLKILISQRDRVENIVGKEENAN